MVWKKFWGVEYYSSSEDITTTFEIFETKEKALNFFNKLQRENKAYELFTQNFNTEHIFYEDNGRLNYEDVNNLTDFNSDKIGLQIIGYLLNIKNGNESKNIT